MRIEVTCPGCSKTMRAHQSLAGKTVRCAGCGRSVQVPPQAAPAGPAAPSAAFSLRLGAAIRLGALLLVLGLVIGVLLGRWTRRPAHGPALQSGKQKPVMPPRPAFPTKPAIPARPVPAGPAAPPPGDDLARQKAEEEKRRAEGQKGRGLPAQDEAATKEGPRGPRRAKLHRRPKSEQAALPPPALSASLPARRA